MTSTLSLFSSLAPVTGSSVPQHQTSTLENSSNQTAAPNNPTQVTPGLIVLGLVLTIVVLLTVIGNIVVLVAFGTERRIRNTFTYYIINLAVTDALVGLTAMSFYTFDVVLGYWPFGEIMCGFWIFCDYGMTFASVFTLVAISIDRYWSVCKSLHYRQHNTRKKTFLALLFVWLAVLVIWLPACISDRVKWSTPGVCIWEPSLNREFVVVIATVGHHFPCLVILFCYYKVVVVMQQKAKRIGAWKKQAGQGGTTVVQVSTIDATATGYAPPSGTVGTAADEESVLASSSHPNEARSGGQAGKVKVTKRESSYNREKKTFVTLSSILISYLVCWVPFHIVFDISAVNPTIVPEALYTFTFWMTYVNSTINPFVYAFSNQDFRTAFKKIILCQCRKNSKK